MKISELLKGVCPCEDNFEITDVVSNSKEVKQDVLFVCIKGERFDGHTAAKQALEKGAAAVITERDLGLEKQYIVENTRNALSLIASNWYGNPTSNLKLIGVTGTNGKTTSVYILRHLLESFGHRVGLIGTIEYDTGFRRVHAPNTTPEPMLLQSMFAEMVDAGCDYVVMEASSQALAQGRLYGEHFCGAIFTNLTEDHLDYHKTQENYFLSKKMLLEMSDVALVNADDKAGRRLITEQPCRTLGFSIEGKSDYSAENIKYTIDGVSYWAIFNEKAYFVKFAMPGEYSAKNSLAALALMIEMGFDEKKAVKALLECSAIRGRSEIIPTGKDFTVMCDFAHTPDALKKILTMIKKFTKGRLICLYGAAGERDAVKRPIMGDVTATLADYLILTSDNPRYEDEQKIVDDLLVGIKNHDTPYVTILDREEAIKYAVSILKSGDVLLLAGKGHEDYQAIKGVDIPFDERKIVLKAIADLK